MTQQFCLRWNNHQPNFISVFTSLLNSESLVDVTLAAEGKHLQAHKVVLSACSVYFQSLFISTPSRHPIVILKDVKYADLRTMVDFMYYGEVNVSQEQLPQVLETAKMLKIKGLTEMPDSASLAKSQNILEQQDNNAPAESSWQNQRQSASPSIMSTSTRKKRLRKNSTGSGSISNERISGLDDKAVEQGGESSINLVKTVADNSGVNSPGMMLCSTNSPFRPRPQQFENFTQDSNTMHALQQPSEEAQNCILRQIDLDETQTTSIHNQGSQWTSLDHGSYQRFATPNCQDSSSPLTQHSVDHMHATFQYMQNQAINQEVNEYQQPPDYIRGVTPNVTLTSSPNTLVPSVIGEVAPPKRRRTHNPQANENFQMALEAVRFGGIGFCKAARMFGVNNRTLWLEYKKKGYAILRPSIKNRIKREQNSPPPDRKDDIRESNETNVVSNDANSLYPAPPPPPTVLGFMDARYLHDHNIHAINFNAVQ